MGVDEEDVSPFDLTIGERAALAEIREIRESVGYEDHPVDDPARAAVYIAALEAKIVAHYEVHVAERDRRRAEAGRERGLLYWLGYLIAVVVLGVWLLGLVWLGSVLVEAIL